MTFGDLGSEDYFRLKGCSKDEIMAQAIRPAYFVPENLKAALLFRNMKKSRNYFAVVLDEYGGINRIITLRDLIEQLVGDLTEEDEEEKPDEIQQISDNVWNIQGVTPLRRCGRGAAYQASGRRFWNVRGIYFREPGFYPCGWQPV